VGFQVVYNQNDQMVLFSGSMRPKTQQELQDTIGTLIKAANKAINMLYLNFNRLEFINNMAFHELMKNIGSILESKPKLKIKIIISSVVPWSKKKMSWLNHLYNQVSIEQYDNNFYPGQEVIENDHFIPVLRTQTKIVWEQEKHLLRQHGLTEGMVVADICCGIGDFISLVYQDFNPARIIGVDHSKPNLKYARKIAKDNGLNKQLEYHYGDAGNLFFLKDNEFDFVTCRLSLQIFDKPELILKELFRICKPGGKVYLTNETYSKTLGYPQLELISKTYDEASKLFQFLGMDLEFGPKMNSYMIDAHLKDIRVDPMMVTTNNTSREDFKMVVESWRNYICNDLAIANGKDEIYRKELEQGFNTHVRTIESPRGFASWPIWVASGSKPE
jgi:ubiquinone/menaquinone biosynthesis C-methylase UbiE